MHNFVIIRQINSQRGGGQRAKSNRIFYTYLRIIYYLLKILIYAITSVQICMYVFIMQEKWCTSCLTPTKEGTRSLCRSDFISNSHFSDSIFTFSLFQTESYKNRLFLPNRLNSKRFKIITLYYYVTIKITL